MLFNSGEKGGGVVVVNFIYVFEIYNFCFFNNIVFLNYGGVIYVDNVNKFEV